MRNKLLTFGFLLATLMTPACAQESVPATAAEEAAMRQTLTRFYRATQGTAYRWNLPPALVSEELHALLQLARIAEKRNMQAVAASAHRQDKPYLREGALFAPLHEGYNRMPVLSHFRCMQNACLADARLTYRDAAETHSWTDAVVLVREKGRWKVDDVIFALDRKDLNFEPSAREKLESYLLKTLFVHTLPVQIRVQAQAGDADAQLMLATELIGEDPAQAQYWLRQSAEGGNADAQQWLGDQAREKGGPEQAFDWYKKSAQAGNSDAIGIVAKMYAEGIGTPPDPAAALHWHIQFADQDDAPSMVEAAKAYAKGIGTAQDLTRAYAWLIVAQPFTCSCSGDCDFADEADALLLDLQARLTPFFQTYANLSEPYQICSCGLAVGFLLHRGRFRSGLATGARAFLSTG